ncbi:hypothetical protein BDZ45DRAFT_397058 [Acephala macrosclerotiorum]|nr:hypothetical protein BDZ45DRAFT_397058 [Acephala macrosclerotiorum]
MDRALGLACCSCIPPIFERTLSHCWDCNVTDCKDRGGEVHCNLCDFDKISMIDSKGLLFEYRYGALADLPSLKSGVDADAKLQKGLELAPAGSSSSDNYQGKFCRKD